MKQPYGFEYIGSKNLYVSHTLKTECIYAFDEDYTYLQQKLF